MVRGLVLKMSFEMTPTTAILSMSSDSRLQGSSQEQSGPLDASKVSQPATSHNKCWC